MNDHVWWYLARATGIVTWLLATAAVLWGMALATRALGPKPRAPWLLDLHRFLGGLSLLFLAAHLSALVADAHVEFGVAEVLVPMASSWRPVPVTLGIVGMYLLVAIEVTSLLRRWMSKRVWHGVHLMSYAVYLLSSIHFLTAGTDAPDLAARIAVVIAGSCVSFFAIYRIIGPGRAESARRLPVAPDGDGGGLRLKEPMASHRNGRRRHVPSHR